MCCINWGVDGLRIGQCSGGYTVDLYLGNGAGGYGAYWISLMG